MQKKFYIKGMHCPSCEILLKRELGKIEGIKVCRVSQKKSTAIIDLDNQDQLNAIENSVVKCGYKIVEESEIVNKSHENSLMDYIEMLLIAVLLGLFTFIFSVLEISQYFPEVGVDVSIWMSLLLGVIASFSTCLALVGGIVLSFGGIYEGEGRSFYSRNIAPHIYFHIGRLLSFTILGGLLGLLGSYVQLSTSVTGYFLIVIAIVMLGLGLRLLNIIPPLASWAIFGKVGDSIDTLEKSSHRFAPFAIGALTFFLPCGFTQSMQLVAISSGSFITGAMVMMFFALGTLPTLLAIGIFSSSASHTSNPFLQKIAGVLVVFFAVFSLNSGLVLTGSSFTLTPSTISTLVSTQDTSIIPEVVVEEGVQVIKMDVDWSFQPAEFYIKKGVPVRWEITGVNVSGCSNRIIVPRLNISKDIVQGKTQIVEFTPKETGVLPFSCWMGMIGGRFIVVD